MFASFGKEPSGKELEKIKSSPNYRNGQFQNPVPTATLAEGASMPKTLWHFLNKQKDTKPPKPLPTVKTNLHQSITGKPLLVWFGHSSYFIRIHNITILVDPVLCGYGAPFSFMNKGFAGTHVYTVDDMPDIDVLLITHDHYDHLDYETVMKLRSKVKSVYTSLGVASHLVYWGYNKEYNYRTGLVAKHNHCRRHAVDCCTGTSFFRQVLQAIYNFVVFLYVNLG